MAKQHCDNWLSDVLQEVYGEIVFLEEECPLVYHLCARKENSISVPQEYYVVAISAPAISSKAKGYGQPIEGLPDFLSYSIDEMDSGQKIIAYEIWRYKVKEQIPIEEPESFREFALFAAEYHPDFFGTFPAPIVTPYGYMVRYQTIDNGIYLVETDEGAELVAFCMPFWEMCSGYTRRFGKHAVYDTPHGLVEEKMYMFFTREQSCLPFFELWQEHPAWKDSPTFNFPAMMNAIWTYFPKYAATYNAMEQRGMHSIEAISEDFLGDIELEARPENMVAITPDVRVEFLNM